MLYLILNSLVPIFLGIGLGLVGGWTRDVDNHHVGELNALVTDFAVPASIFAAGVSHSRITPNDHLGVAGVMTAIMLLMYAGVFVMARRAFGSTPGEAAIQAIACGSMFMSPVTLTILSLKAKPASLGAIVSTFLGASRTTRRAESGEEVSLVGTGRRPSRGCCCGLISGSDRSRT